MDFCEYARALDHRWRAAASPAPSASLITLRQVASTHLLGRRIAEEYTRENLVPPTADLIAWEQTAGIGREDRRWSSPAGQGVYLTSIRTMSRRAAASEGSEAASREEPSPRENRVQFLPLAAAVALCEVLNRLVTGEPIPERGGCRLKWPNDIQVGDCKLGGILIDVLGSGLGERPARAREPDAVKERRSRRRSTAVAVLSVGVNVARDPAIFGEERATSLDLEASRCGRGPIPADELAEELAAALSRAAAGTVGSEDLLGRYRRLSLHRPGDTIRCRVDSELVDGIFEGFDRLGFLELTVGGERKRLSSGVIVGK